MNDPEMNALIMKLTFIGDLKMKAAAFLKLVDLMYNRFAQYNDSWITFTCGRSMPETESDTIP